MLELREIRYGIGRADILNGVSARFESGRLSMIIGPNGSGKSTLLKIASLELTPTSGEVLYGAAGQPRRERGELARIRAVLSQNIEIAFPLTVDEVVLMGRYPHFASRPSAHDLEICAMAMARAGVEQFRERDYLTLSGGEKQMVQFARVLAQIWEAPPAGDRYLLLDEPTAFLDVNHQHHLLTSLRAIAAENVTVVTVIHDINLASQYADHIVALHRGSKVAEGEPKRVISPDLFATLYGMNGTVVTSGDLDFPLIIFQ